MQGWSLARKIQVSQTRILEWYTKHDGTSATYLFRRQGFTVLAYLAAKVCMIQKCKLILWFSDTGLEFPELKSHVKTYGKWLKEQFPGLEVETVIDYPKDRKGNRISFRDVILKYGYPILSKTSAVNP